ncbi:hypothetical protein M9H77_07135 [Catharanthus roseus]|uniref:Uncharacterized protein n=1 Tax=Catharanthus roseus TaxID=4058 RepID=A0ACC0BU95_CATRO|nr:hypothetical protein M9H77_07135 [Catharanthus roseus]
MGCNFFLKNTACTDVNLVSLTRIGYQNGFEPKASYEILPGQIDNTEGLVSRLLAEELVAWITVRRFEENMKNYLAFALSFTSGFLQIHFEKVSRSQNTRADILSKPGLCETNEGNMDGVLERKKYRQKNMYNHRKTIITTEVGVKSLRNEALNEEINSQLKNKSSVVRQNSSKRSTKEIE